MSVSSMPWKNLSLPAQLTRIRSMLSDEEKQYLMWLTAEKFEGWGAIVDLGPWLGSSSAALAEGLKRGGKQDKIFAFDLFRWEPSYMDAVGHENLKEGDDFLDLFVREIGDYSQWIEPKKQDLKNYLWTDGPIEILFVDAAKTWELTNAIFKGFGSHLVPGRSRIVLQDFRYDSTHWLPLIFDSRPDLWKEVESVENGWTVAFLPQKLLFGPTGIRTDYSEKAFPLEMAEHLLRSRMAREAPSNRLLILRSLYNKCLCDGSAEDVQRLREEFLTEGIEPNELDEMGDGDVESILVPQGWKAYNQQDYFTARAIAERCLAVTKSRPVHAVALLGISLLRLDDREGARSCIEDVIGRLPDYLPARLFRAELALAEGRYLEAETEALQVLKRSLGDETTIDYSLNVLAQAWQRDSRVEHAVNTLKDLVGTFSENPTFLAHFAREQFEVGQKNEAMLNVEKALNLAPDHKLAARLRVEWSLLDKSRSRKVGGSPENSRTIEASPAGRLNKSVIPSRPAALRHVSLAELSGELLARIAEGSFGANEASILLGCELHKALEVVLDVHNNRLSGRRYSDLFGAFYEYVGRLRPRLDGATILELGCGSINPYGLLFLFLMLGGQRGIAIDLDEIQDMPRAVRALADLSAKMLIHPEEIVGDYPTTRQQILQNIASFDLSRLHSGDLLGLDADRLSYRRESVHALSLLDGEVDYTISNAFFEHVPHIEDAIAELARVTRTGGIGVHTIDGSDHRRYNNPTCHPLEFLTEASNEPIVYGSNRNRPLQFAALFEKHSFEVIAIEPFERVDISPELRNRLVEPFRSMGDELLTVTIAKVVVRRL